MLRCNVLLLQVVVVFLVPIVQAATSWQWVTVMLCPGPYLGAVAILALKLSPDVKRIANGLG
jgi:flagellar biosynthesis protein FliQ